jgi:hypothetical protein
MQRMAGQLPAFHSLSALVEASSFSPMIINADIMLNRPSRYWRYDTALQPSPAVPRALIPTDPRRNYHTAFNI